MAQTPRNNISVNVYRGGNEDVLLQSVDALYEIADAELTSDKRVHQVWKNLALSHKEFRRLFARNIRQYIRQCAINHQIPFWCEHWVEVVSLRIADDFADAYVDPFKRL